MNRLFCIILFCAKVMMAQNNCSSGTIKIINGQTYAFKDLVIKDTQVIFVNKDTNKKVYHLLNAIDSIYDDEGNEVYVNNIKSIAIKEDPSITSNEANTEENEAVDDFVNPYPEGVYYTKEDFINKKVSDLSIVPKLMYYSEDEFDEDNLPNQIYFYDKSKNTKIKNIFAISYQNKLYFQVKSILKNCNYKDKKC